MDDPRTAPQNQDRVRRAELLAQAAAGAAGQVDQRERYVVVSRHWRGPSAAAA
jgi:hypothetical protein